MIAFLLAAAALALLAPAYAADGPRADLSYRLALIDGPAGYEGLAVTLAFRGEDDGETMLELPDEWAGRDALWRSIDALTVNGADIAPGETPALRRLRHAPGADVTVRYRVVDGLGGPPTAGTGGNPYRPIVQPDYVHLIGNTFIVRPQWDEGATRASVDIVQPSRVGHRVASDLEHGDPTLTLGAVIESVFVGGDFRITTAAIDGAPARIAIRGDWDFDDAEFVEKAAAAMRANHAYWEDPGEPFLVTVLPLAAAENSSSVGGTGRTDAFAFFASRNADDFRIRRTLGHEHAHTWTPRRLGRMPQGGDEALDYWFSEGFTEFLTVRTAARAGIWSLAEAVGDLNEIMGLYAENPARTAPNARIGDAFWTDQDVGRLPYQRGALLAFYWDRKLNAETGGRVDLDDVFRALKADYADAERAEGETAAQAFLRVAEAVAGVDLRDDFERYIVDGAPVLLPADTFTACGTVTTRTGPMFDYGFTFTSNEADEIVIQTVAPGSNAERAGVRAGMVYLERLEGEPGDPSKDYLVRFRDGTQERLLRWRPAGRAVTAQTLELRQDVDAGACLASIGGLHAGAEAP